MTHWYNFPEQIKLKQIDEATYPCLDTDKFNDLAKKTEWANIVRTVKSMYAILGKQEAVHWYNLPKRVEELSLLIDIYECN